MSAAFHLAPSWGEIAATAERRLPFRGRADRTSTEAKAEPKVECRTEPNANSAPAAERLAFYRRHTENILRRYLYASMQVGRAPSILSDPVGRGWASSRPIRTFEDAVIFVLDVERCLDQLGALERQLLCRVVLQEYTQAETAVMLGMSTRTISYKFPQALDRLTELLLKGGLLVVPC
jgi:hypothetical protein